MAQQVLPELDRSVVEALSGPLEPDALRHARLDALERYLTLALPTDRTEGWRRTNLSGIDLSPVQPSTSACEVKIADEDRAKGVEVRPLADAIASGASSEIVKVRNALTLGKFSTLAQSLWQGGQYVRIPNGVQLSKPIIVEWKGGPYPRLTVDVGKGAQAAILERHAQDERFVSGIVDLILDDDALLRYAHLQECGSKTVVFSHQHARIARDAKLITLNFALGGTLSRADVEVELLAPGAESDMLGLIFGERSQQFDFHTLQGHRSPNTRSDLLFKSALDDKSHSSYTGVITIEKGAQRSDAYQANRNLLLSEGARADTEPKLEIEADDVRCTHGATVGPIDAEQLFYTMSRGLDPDHAARLIVEGFFLEVFEKFGDGAISRELQQKVSPHLGRVAAH